MTSTTLLVENIEYIFDTLFTMIEEVKRDLLNHQLSMMRAHLSTNGEGLKYQREMFKKRLEKGTFQKLKKIKNVVKCALYYL